MFVHYTGVYIQEYHGTLPTAGIDNLSKLNAHCIPISLFISYRKLNYVYTLTRFVFNYLIDY